MPPKESGKLPSSRTKMGEPSARRRSLGVIHRDKQAARQKEREETLSARDNLNHVGGGKTSNHQAPKSPSADPGQLPVSPASDSDSDSGSGSVFTESDEDSHSTVQGSRTPQKTPGKTPGSSMLLPRSSRPASPIPDSANTTGASASSSSSSATGMDSSDRAALGTSLDNVEKTMLAQHPNQSVGSNWHRARDSFLTALFSQCTQFNMAPAEIMRKILQNPDSLRDLPNEFEAEDGQKRSAHTENFYFGEKIRLVEQIERNLQSNSAEKKEEVRQGLLSQNDEILNEEQKKQAEIEKAQISDRIKLIQQALGIFRKEGTGEGARLIAYELLTSENTNRLRELYEAAQKACPNQGDSRASAPGMSFRITVDPPSTEASLSCVSTHEQKQNLDTSINVINNTLDSLGQSDNHRRIEIDEPVAEDCRRWRPDHAKR